MKKLLMADLRLLLLAALVATGANAEVVTWSGAAGDGDWTNGDNWQGGAVPAATDVARFTAAATVAPPAAFTGTLKIENATVTIPVNDAREFSSAVRKNGKLVKTGSGTLKLRAATGYNPGEISVSEGTVTFAGSGAYAAPGAFGRLTVAPGATAAIADSAASTRHGALSIAVDRGAGKRIEYVDYTNSIPNFASFETAWNAIEVTNDNQRIIYQPTEAKPHFQKANVWMPTFYQWRDYFNLFSRTLFIVPSAGKTTFRMQADDFAILFVDEEKILVCNNNLLSASSTLAAGWHAIDLALSENSGNEIVNMQVESTGHGVESRLISDMLWNGVCFNDVVLNEGATFSVAAGQAVAIASGATTTIAGNVIGAADSVVTIAGGAFSSSAARFAGFAGEIELTRFASADMSDLPETPAFRLAGNGRVLSGMNNVLGGNFTGIVEIPSGITITNTLSLSVAFTGSGTLVTPTLACTKDFTGTVVVTGTAADVAEIDGTPSVGSWILSDGSQVKFGKDALLVRAETVTDGFTQSDWKLSGSSNSNGSGLFTGNIAYFTNDVVLVLTDDGGSQRNSAIYTKRTFTADSDFEVSFVYRNEMLKRFNTESRAEGASFFFTTDGNWVNSNNSMAWPTGAYGFGFYQYRDVATQGLYWIDAGGWTPSAPTYTEAQMGIDMRNAVDVKISLKKGMMHVELRQGNKVFKTKHDVSAAFSSGVKRYFGMSGGTGFWGVPPAAADVYCYQTISNFVGRVFGEGSEVDVSGYLPPSADKWTLRSEGVAITNDTELLFAWKVKENNVVWYGWSRSNKKLPVHRPFTLVYNENLDKVTVNWAEGVDVFFSPHGDVKSGWYFQESQGVCFGHYYWENQYFWVHNNAKYSNDLSDSNPGGIPKTVGVNKVRIDYDGAGTFTATVSRGNSVWTSTRHYPDVLNWGDEMYFGFMGGTSGWGAYLQTRITDIDLTFSDNPPLSIPAATVDAGAVAGIVLGNVETTSANPSFTCDALTLGAAGTLNVTAESGNGARLALGAVTTDAGGGTIACADGAVVQLSDVYAAGPLTVTGAWAGDIVFHVDASKIGGGTVLANLDPAKFAGDGEVQFSAVGLDGKDLSKNFKISVNNSQVRLNAAGIVIFIR